MLERSVWAEIDLSAVEHNVKEIRRWVKPTAKLCAVVKADGYGHGAVPTAKAVLKAGADCLAVAIVSEALELRQAGIDVPILILGYTPPEQAEIVIANDITQTVFSLEVAQALSAAAVRLGSTARVHIKVDTGMGRVGIRPQESGDFALKVAALPNIFIEGIYSHFAASDSSDKSFTLQQYKRFMAAVERVEARGIKIPVRHVANSAAVLDLPQTHLDMIRPGIILYGLWPSDEVKHQLDLRPAMKLKAQIGFVKSVPVGTPISYGLAFYTQRQSRIATLPVGYADGWSRLLANRAKVLIKGQPAALVGRVCMDQCMVDVTEIPGVRAGEEALLFGGSELPVEEVARHMGTIHYEVICMIGKRVPRSYPD